MKAEPTSKLPDPLDRIQLRTVGRKEVQAQRLSIAHSPVFVENGVMVLGIVRNHNCRPPASPCDLLQGTQELEKGSSVEPLRLAAEHQLAVSQAHCSKIANTSPRRIVQEDWLLDFRRNPHTAAGAMLPEVHFITGPKIHVPSPHKLSEFFLCCAWSSGSAWAISGRGFRSRKPKNRKNRLHCRTPRVIPNCCSIQADKVFPSQIRPAKPKSSGLLRRAFPTSSSCFSSSLGGRPARATSTRPAKPSCSKRWTQFSTVCGESPSRWATSRQLMP